MSKKVPLSWLMTGGILGLVILSCGLILFLSLGLAQKNTSNLVGDKAALVVSLVTEQIYNDLIPAEEQLIYLEQRIKQEQIDLNNHDSVVQAFSLALAGTPQVATLLYLDNNRQVTMVSQAVGEELYIETSDWQQLSFIDELMSQVEPKWLEPVFVGEIGRTVISHSRPLFIADKYQGLLLASVHTADFSDNLKELGSRYDTTPFILYGEDRVLATPDRVPAMAQSGETAAESINWQTNLLLLEDSDDPVLSQMWSPENSFELEPDKNEEFKARWLEQDGLINDYLFFYLQINDFGETPWLIGCYFDEQSIASEFELIEKTLYWALGILALALLFAWWFSRKLSTPVLDFSSITQQVYQDDLSKVPKLESSFIREFDQAAHSFNHMINGLKEKKQMRETFGKYVPNAMAGEILSKGILVPQTRETTTLFTDIVGFSTMSEKLAPEQIIDFLNDYFSAIIVPIEKYNGVVHQFQGDAVLATFNLPIEDVDHAVNAVRVGLEIIDICKTHAFGNGMQIKTRIGINTGDAVCGTIGGESRLGFTVHGDHVNLAARIEQLNKEFNTQILVSGSTHTLTKDEFNYEFVGQIPIRGRSQHERLYTITP